MSGLDKRENSIALNYNTRLITGALIGKMNNSTLTIKVDKDGKTLDINVYLFGNLGSGGQEAANKILEEFKSRLSNRLAQ